MTIELSADEMREQIERIIAGTVFPSNPDMSGDPRRRLRSHQMRAVQDAATEILPLFTSTASYRAGAEDMREACREKIKDLSRAEKRDTRGDHRSAAFWDVFCELAKIPLPDPQPTPTQESRDA